MIQFLFTFFCNNPLFSTNSFCNKSFFRYFSKKISYFSQFLVLS